MRSPQAAARFGGPVAIVRDDRRIIRATTKGVGKSGAVSVYSSAGRLLGAFTWDRPSRLAAFGWSEQEALLCCAEDGMVFPYSAAGELLAWQFSFGPAAAQQGLADALIWPSGAVALTRSRQLLAVLNFDDPRVCALPELPPDAGMPHLIAVIEPRLSAHGGLEVLLAAGSTVWSVTADGGARDCLPHLGCRATHIAVAPNGLLVAVYTEDGRLRVLSSDFSRSFSELPSRTSAPLEALAWCGADCVILLWPELLLVVGPDGDAIRFPYDEAAALVPEMDGCRVLTRSRHELIRRVPDALHAVFAIGSTAPAALLYDAMDSFDRGSAKADELLRQVGPNLLAAAEGCIAAAGHALDPASQRQLLRAAAYGHSFCALAERLPHHVFPGMCRTLRLLNALRQHDQGGMSVTFIQYQQLSPAALLQRLVNARTFLLAMRVAEARGPPAPGHFAPASQLLIFLGEPPYSVLLQWAGAKMAASVALSDRELLDALMEKLVAAPGLPFNQVAADAYRRGRPRLAALLLDFETRSSEQVPLLTTMGEDDRALVKAIESADSDLVYLSIFNLYRKQSDFAVFAAAVAAHKTARDLFVAYMRRTDPDLLKSFHFATGDAEGTADAVLAEALYGPRGEGLLAPALAAKLMQQAGELYGKGAGKEALFAAGAAADAARLLRSQMELEAEARQEGAYQGLSVADTIAKCALAGNTRAVAALQKEFKVSDKHLCWIRLRAMAARRDWDGVVALAEERKPPIGYLPFVEVASDERAPKHDLAKLIGKLPEAAHRVEWYTQAGLMAQAQAAAEEAAEKANASFTRQAASAITSTFARLGTGAGAGGGAEGGGA